MSTPHLILRHVSQTISLSKHLIFLRHTFDIAPAPSFPPSPPPPKARRPPLGSVASPQMPRLSRPPTIPGISEDNECSSADEQPKRQPVNAQTTSPARRKIKAKPRLSASRLPLPSRGSPPLLDIPTSPTVPPPMEVALSNGGSASKHLPRRQSGFLTVDLPPSLQRPPSPAFGSPILLNAALDDDGETTDARGVDDPDYESEEKVTKRDKRKGKAKESALEKESLIDVPRSRERDRKRPREDDFSPSTVVADNKLKLVDVTNSPRPTLSSLDPGVTGACRRDPISRSYLAILSNLPFYFQIESVIRLQIMTFIRPQRAQVLCRRQQRQARQRNFRHPVRRPVPFPFHPQNQNQARPP